MKKLYKLSILALIILSGVKENANAQWIPMTNGLPPGTLRSFATSGTNIFAGCIPFGAYLSTNDGNSWTAVNTGLTNTFVWTLATSGTNIFAGTFGGGVFLSTNNGSSWTAVNTGLTNLNATAIAISGTNIFVGTDSSGVFLSTNNGSSWTPVNTGLPANLGVFSLVISGSNIFAGTAFSGVFLSSNNGSSWAPVNNGLLSPSVFLIFSLEINGSTIFAGTNDGVYLSSNNGTLWTLSGLTGQYARAFKISGINIFAGTDMGVYLSTNNGNSWTAENTGFPGGTADIYSLGISSTNIFAGFSDADTAGWRRPVSEMVGIYETNISNAFISVYPNPFSTQTTLQTDKILKDVTLTVYNSFGQTVKQIKNILGQTVTLSRDNLASGLYFVRLTEENKIIAVDKLVITDK